MTGEQAGTTSAKGKSRRGWKRSVLPAVGALLIVAAIIGYSFYHRITKPVIDLGDRKYVFFYIPTGSGFCAVRDSLVKRGYLSDPGSFEWLAKKKHYPEKVRPGRYRLFDGMRNNALVNLLRSGKQEPVRVVVQNVRTPAELAGRIGRQLEADSSDLIRLFSDRNTLSSYGVTPLSLFVLFIPDTYEFFWNTSGQQLLDRMQRESRKFWLPRRKEMADSLHLSQAQVVTLASIVDKETLKNAEKPVIAGVYLNRLKRGMPLQADPTVVFALNDRTIRRVVKRHTAIDSPYNTYIHAGLPPGPICLPSASSIDAVLRPARHSYLYFCARADLSGYHTFSTTLEEHNLKARQYQKALDKMNIR